MNYCLELFLCYLYQLLLSKGIKEWRVMCVDPIGRANLNDGILLDKEGLVRMYHFITEKRLEGKMVVDNDCSHYLGLKYEQITRPHGFFCGAGLFIGCLIFQHAIVSPKDISKVNLAFSTTNGVASVVYAAFTIASVCF